MVAWRAPRCLEVENWVEIDPKSKPKSVPKCFRMGNLSKGLFDTLLGHHESVLVPLGKVLSAPSGVLCLFD